MARTKTVVDKTELQTNINTLEASGPLAGGLSELFDKLAATPWATAKSYTASVLRARATEYNIVPKTPKGKPGRQKKAVASTSAETTAK